MTFNRCDIVFTRSNSWLGKAIRFFTRDKGEKITEVNHVGMIANDGDAVDSIIIESLRKTVKHKLSEGYGDLSTIAIARPLNITEEGKVKIVTKMESYVGKTYGYVKIVLHLGDWVLKNIKGGNSNPYFFRRFAKMDNYPICSYSLAQSYSADEKDFGVPPNTASPDDIWDFCVANPDKYAFIYVGSKIHLDFGRKNGKN